MPATSAGLLLYRLTARGVEVFLVHPGGPYWSRKDLGAWSIPKGETSPGEDPLVAARREFAEETGRAIEGPALSLGDVRQAGGKRVHAWAVRGDLDPERIRSNTFDLEWPPRSGVVRAFPEVDRAAWFPIDEARRRLLPSQAPFLDRLLDAVGEPSDRP
ncbi:MAG TPA: NUDIX domain-containing protein [Myxococcota bacterium]|jgi:predicted NUDIX family NTP pyrophosphohydrolase|nr:NUDIX domain-containing protein [Myxococcota bacterium]